MIVKNGYDRAIELEFDDGNVVIPVGGAVRIHVGLFSEPEITLGPFMGGGTDLNIHWGKSKVKVERL